MSVQPDKGSWLMNRKFNVARLSRIDRSMTAAILDRSRNCQAMPVKSRYFGQVVDIVNVHGLSIFKDDGFAKQRSVISPGCGLFAWQELNGTGLRGDRIVNISSSFLIGF